MYPQISKRWRFFYSKIYDPSNLHLSYPFSPCWSVSHPYMSVILLINVDNYITAYFCHGSWEDNGISYLIASPVSRDSVGARRFCFIYTHSGGESNSGLSQNTEGSKRGSLSSVASMLRLSSVTESCHRNINPGVTGVWAFNLTINGKYAVFKIIICFIYCRILHLSM